MTYSSLVDDVITYVERSGDQAFISQVPRFIMLAENRIAVEVHGLGLLRVATNAFSANEPVVTKPTRWRETISFNYGTGTSNNTRNFLRLRSYEYCRTYWPDSSVTGEPKYYCDYDWNHWLIVGTPPSAYPFEIVYHERPLPLSAENQTNWTTESAPQLILYATLLEAMPFLKDDQRKAVFQAEYDRAAKQVDYEAQRQVVDRTAVVAKG
jgi:hypothetical protein